MMAPKLEKAEKHKWLFKGIPEKELTYLRLAALPCIALLTDVIIDLYEKEFHD